MRGDASIVSRGDAAGVPKLSPDVVGDGSHRCPWCERSFRPERRDAVFCCKRHRQAHWKFARYGVSVARARAPKRVRYDDPPYPGLSSVYYRDHPDYGGEVDHRRLLAELVTFDGWALSTNEDSLQEIMGMCAELGVHPHTAIWVKGSMPFIKARHPLPAWEPVVYVPCREIPALGRVDDVLVHKPNPRSDPGYIVGAKPAAFCFWMFQLLSAQPGDSFEDSFRGSGGVRRAWNLYDQRAQPSTDEGA